MITSKNPTPYIIAFITVAVFTLVILILAIWPSGHLIFSDVTEGVTSSNFFSRYWYTFDNNIGQSLVEQARLPIMSLVWLIFKLLPLAIDGFIKIKITLLYLASSAAFTASLYLLRSYLPPIKSKPVLVFALITANLIYLFNPWMNNRLVHFFLFFASVNIPLVFALYTDLLWHPRFSSGKLISLITVLATTLGTPHILLFDGLIIATITLYSAFQPTSQFRQRIVQVLPLVVLGATLASAYWLLPYLLTGTVAPDRAESVDIFLLLSQNASLPNALRLIGYWWFDISKYYSSVPLIHLLQWLGSWILPLSFITFIITHRQHRLANQLALIAFCALFLASTTIFSQPFYYFLMFTPLLAKFGWIWREVDKFGLLVVYVFSISFFINIGQFFAFRIKRYVLLTSLVLLAIFLSSHSYTILTTDFKPQDVPNAFTLVNDYLAADPETFNVVWYPGVSQPDWATTADNPFALMNLSSAKPIFNTSQDTRYLINYLLNSQNISDVDLAETLQMFGIKYLIIRNDDPMYSQDQLLGVIDSKRGLEQVFTSAFLTVFRNNRFTQISQIAQKQVQTNLGLEIFKYIDELHINPTNTIITFLDDSSNEPLPLDTSAYILENGAIIDAIMPYFKSQFIYPYQFTHRAQPFETWSKGSLTDQIHAESHFYLNAQNINNSQLDYGGGVVIAENELQLTGGRLVNDLGGLSKISYPLQFSEQNQVKLTAGNGKYALKYAFNPAIELNPFWKIIRSTPIELDPTNLPRAIYIESNINLLGQSADVIKPHIKVTYFNAQNEQIKQNHLVPDAQGKVQFVSQIPAQTTHLELSFWSAVSSTPYNIEVNSIRLVDITSEVEPMTLSGQTQSQCITQCLVYVRVLKSNTGGLIDLNVNNQQFSIPTFGSYNRFEWINIGPLKNPQKQINFTFRDRGGFNVINAMAIISADELTQATKVVQNSIDHAQLITAIQPETALPITRVNAQSYLGASSTTPSWPLPWLKNSSPAILTIKQMGTDLPAALISLVNDSTSTNQTLNISLNTTSTDYNYIPTIFMIEPTESPIVNSSPQTIVNIINPTLFTIESNPSELNPGTRALTLARSFDPSWILSGQQTATKFNPIVVNGFATGWLINNQSTKYLVEYAPQKAFYIGGLVSIATMLGLLLWWYHRHHQLDK